MQGRNRDADVENIRADVVAGKGAGINWEIRTDIYTLPCTK